MIEHFHHGLSRCLDKHRGGLLDGDARTVLSVEGCRWCRSDDGAEAWARLLSITRVDLRANLDGALVRSATVAELLTVFATLVAERVVWSLRRYPAAGVGSITVRDDDRFATGPASGAEHERSLRRVFRALVVVVPALRADVTAVFAHTIN